MTLEWVAYPRAEQDLDEITWYLADQGGDDMELLFLDTFYASVERLARSPRIGWHCRLKNPRLADSRVISIDKPFEKYLIFYTATEQALQILRVLHGSQDLEALFEKTN